MNENQILARIGHLPSIGGEFGERDGVASDIAREVYLGTLSLVANVYGPNSRHVHAVQDSNARIAQYNWSQPLRDNAMVKEMRGILKAVRGDITAGLVTSIRSQAKGEVLADFVLLARRALDDGSKDVAAVLACAALEDSLKRYAELQGLDCDDKELADVINALKGAGVVQGPQGKVLQAFVGVRNRTFHAQWDRVDAADVSSVISFVQTFLTERFS